MARFVMRVLAPLRVRRAVLGRFDSRYVTRADHRQDVRDSLWEVQALKRELTALRREVEQLRQRVAVASKATASTDPALAARVEDAHRLATETASAVDHVLQAEVLLWQAVDALREGNEGGGNAAGGREKAAP
ncbi:hypothetical protein GCM10022226_72220 [Sphaerisporangium flaviroseum]|uniref:Cell division protein DivIVA n=1 Tax=Sphaerisporangium flaviroseum TaxID=509199 RepID=A0ABP7JAT6_9ACTN